MNPLSKHVFILGAGSSKHYGFPTGKELIQDISENSKARFSQYIKANPTTPEKLRYYDNRVSVFSNLLSAVVDTISIDWFLNHHNSFTDIGIPALIASIINYEFHFMHIKDPQRINSDWYNYLFSTLIKGCKTFEDFSTALTNNISFITFNYDRSLEHFLFANLSSIFIDKSEEEICSVINQIPIIHVYGKIGYLPWEKGQGANESNIIPYGEAKPEDFFKYGFKNVDSISLIYDDRIQQDTKIRATQLIAQSKYIYFLGFGYDEINLSNIGLPQLLEQKRVYGTAFNCTPNEISVIEYLLQNKKHPKSVINSFLEISNYSCYDLLRNYYHPYK